MLCPTDKLLMTIDIFILNKYNYIYYKKEEEEKLPENVFIGE